MNIDLNVISHIVLDDKVFYSEEPIKTIKEVLGGPVSFASMVVPLLSKQVVGITAIGQNFPKKFIQYFDNIENYTLRYFQSGKTTKFLHEIHDQKRDLFLLSRADNLDNFIPLQAGAKACLLSPVYDEITKSSVEWAMKNHKFVGIDVQGFMRKKDKDNRIFTSFDEQFIKWLIQSVDIVKFSYNEAASFTQEKSLKEILNSLPSDNIQIVTMGDKGLVYSNKGKHYKLSAPTRKEKDPTGSGDVLMTFLLSETETKIELDFLLSYGMALVAEKVEHHKVEALPEKNYEELAEKILETKKEIK